MSNIVKFLEEGLIFEKKSTHGRFIDLEGQKFGKLTAIGFAGISEGVSRWFCRCECGNTTKVDAGNLRRGNTISCGCFMTEKVKEMKTSHGHTVMRRPSALYMTWCSMLRRCRNPNTKMYPYYGGRGITVCKRWEKFENFLEDMGERPEGLTIERIDNDGNYGPGNCRWATKREQNNNKRNNRLITFNNKTQNVTKWSIETGICKSTIMKRVNNLGWSIEKALTESVAKNV